MATVARLGNGELQRCGDVTDEDDRWRMQRQWYNFSNQTWEGIHNQMADQIQVTGPFVRQDVLTMLDIGCESFRVGVRKRS